MALEFYKRRFRIPSKKMQYFIAFTALLLVLAAVIGWMLIRHKLSLIGSEDGTSNPSSSAIAAEQYTADDEAHLLVIFTDDTVTRFTLIRTDPANAAITVTAIPDSATSDDGQTLSVLYQKYGGARTASAVASVLEVPLRHYMAVSADNAEKWCGRLENGLTVTVASPLSYPAADGTMAQLSVGEHTLNAAETVALLGYADTPDQITADILAAMLRQYLRTGRTLSADFSFLANIAQTGLRIGDFNDYRDALAHLAEKNAEGNCSISATTAPVS